MCSLNINTNYSRLCHESPSFRNFLFIFPLLVELITFYLSFNPFHTFQSLYMCISTKCSHNFRNLSFICLKLAHFIFFLGFFEYYYSTSSFRHNDSLKCNQKFDFRASMQLNSLSLSIESHGTLLSVFTNTFTVTTFRD